MKIKKSKKSHKKIAATLIALALLMVGALVTYAYITSTPNSPSNTTKDQKEAGDSIKKQSIENDSKSSTSGIDRPPEPSSQEGSDLKTVEMSITAVNQSDSLLQIRSLISILNSTGSCTLTLSKGSEKITKIAGVQAQSSTSTCKGFDIPLSDLSHGTWQVNVKFTDENLQGSVTKAVEIN